MVTKDELLAAMQRECDICVHLYGKIPDGGLTYRPTEGQRDTTELLRYLSFVGIGAARSLAAGDWQAYSEGEEAAAGLAPEAFPDAMERQKRALAELFDGLSEEVFRTREATLPWGATCRLGRALLELPYACLVAYRMQLFLYAKAAGNHALQTPNCWAGVDMDI